MQRRAFLQHSVLGLVSTGTAATSLLRFPALPARPADGPLRLGANENPHGPSPAALQAIREGLALAHRYPFAAHGNLVSALAKHHGLAPDQVVLGAGSSEVLQMAVQAFAGTGAVIVLASPTYEDAPGYASPWQLRVEAVPLRADWAHDVARMREVAEACKGPAVVYVCNPNNPTGTVTPAAELDKWIESSTGKVTFLVDEAYFEFADGAPGFGSATKWIQSRDNVIVTRTFSKIHGLAGLRIGYGLAHRDLAARLRRLQSHNDCNILGLLAAGACLADSSHAEASLRSNAAAREVVAGVLKELDLRALPSHANFVMHEIRTDHAAYTSRMLEAGIVVGRAFPPLLGYNRVSLGTPEDMGRFAETLRDFRKKGWV
jgi:histidinol-phosphate aminotransferase